MEAVYCACMLANLEGLTHSALPKEPLLAPTLAALDARTQKLEGSRPGLLAPPPPTPLTWSALAWRVARVAFKTNSMGIALVTIPQVPLSASHELLETIIDSLNNTAPGTIPDQAHARRTAPADDGDDEKTVCDDKDADEKRLNVIRQSVCFALGKRNKKIGQVPQDLAATCSFALYLCLEVERWPTKIGRPPPSWHVGPPPPPNLQAGVPRGTIGVAKRCQCSCHSRREEKKPSMGSRIGGFFRKMAWWRKKDEGTDSDTESCYTTSSSGTSIVDR